jgi:hypothetical protein
LIRVRINHTAGFCHFANPMIRQCRHEKSPRVEILMLLSASNPILILAEQESIIAVNSCK